jgi:hypothetical protein
MIFPPSRAHTVTKALEKGSKKERKSKLLKKKKFYWKENLCSLERDKDWVFYYKGNVSIAY